MLLTYTLTFSLVTLVTEASIASDCLRFLLDDEFQVHCAALPSTDTKPCLVSTVEDHEYLQRYGIVSSQQTSIGQMVCSRKDYLNDVDCVKTNIHTNIKLDWMWTEWAAVPESSMKSRSISYTDSGVTKLCPYKETQRVPDIVMKHTIDNYGEAYADGQMVDNTARFASVVTSSLPGNTQVIAFKVFNQGAGNPVGPRVWLSTGVITQTGRGWKCSLVYEEGWNLLGFDDSHWGEVNVQYTGHTSVVGHGAVTVGCISTAVGPFYFRKTLV